MKRAKKSGGGLKKHLASFSIMGVVFAVVLALYMAGAFTFLEYKAYDLRVNALSGQSRPSDDIIVILLNQASIDWANRERGWGWPWPRKAFAEIVDYMNLGGAHSIAFDVLFSEPSVYRNARQDAIIDSAVAGLEDFRFTENEPQNAPPQERRQTGQRRTGENGGPPAGREALRNIIGALRTLSSREDDASFVKAELDFGRVVQTVMFSSDTGNAEHWPEDLDKPLFELHNFEDIIGEYEKLNQNVEAGQIRAQFPIEDLRNAAGVVSNVSGWDDSDGTFRRANLFSIFDGKAVPGLSAASLLAAGDDRNITYNKQKRAIEWGGRIIPVDKNGRSILKFRGDLDRYIPYFAHEILMSKEAYETGTIEALGGAYLPPEDFAGKYVFFGYYAPGLFDIATTPISSKYPGVGMHITMLDNILSGDFIRQTSLLFDILLILAAAAAISLVTLYINRIRVSVVSLIIVILGIAIGGFAAYGRGNVWMPMIAPFAASILAFLTATLYNYATEGKQKVFIKNAFSRILSPKVIDQIIADPSQLKLGGEKRKMTAIFTDIQRFSSISSELQDKYGEDGPKVLVNLLNLYLTEMSNIVLANGGTIDKYEGDAIIAFFGAPVWMENHAALACRSAIQMKKRELELREIIMNPENEFCAPLNRLIEGKVIRSESPLYTRLGLNTGDMVVGFMGTPNKMDYTIMGNAVNLAARLEGVNKQYDTRGILISEYTREQIGDEFIIRPLSRVTVVGIPVPLRLYELLDIRSEAPPEMLDMVKSWEKAFDAYERREFLEAKNTFGLIYQRDNNDKAAKLYLDRCDKFINAPPPPDWDGVDNLTEK